MAENSAKRSNQTKLPPIPPLSPASAKTSPLIKKYCCPLKFKRTIYYKQLLSATPSGTTILLPNPQPQPPGLRIFFAQQSPNCQISKKAVIKQQENSSHTHFKVIKLDLKKFCADLKNFRADLTKKSRAKRCNVSPRNVAAFRPKPCSVSPEIFSLSGFKNFLSPCFQSLKWLQKILKCAHDVTHWK